MINTCIYNTYNINIHRLRLYCEYPVTVQRENFETYFSDVSDSYDFNIAVTTFTFSVFS